METATNSPPPFTLRNAAFKLGHREIGPFRFSSRSSRGMAARSGFPPAREPVYTPLRSCLRRIIWPDIASPLKPVRWSKFGKRGNQRGSENYGASGGWRDRAGAGRAHRAG